MLIKIFKVLQAYKKYLKWLGKEEPPLPGLERFTNEQMFFINFAQVLYYFLLHIQILLQYASSVELGKSNTFNCTRRSFNS